MHGFEQHFKLNALYETGTTQRHIYKNLNRKRYVKVSLSVRR